MNQNNENFNNQQNQPPFENQPQYDNQPQPTADFPMIQNVADGFDGYSDYDPSLEMRQRQQGPFTREQLKHNLRSSGFDESSVNHFDDTVVGNYTPAPTPPQQQVLGQNPQPVAQDDFVPAIFPGQPVQQGGALQQTPGQAPGQPPRQPQQQQPQQQQVSPPKGSQPGMRGAPPNPQKVANAYQNATPGQPRPSRPGRPMPKRQPLDVQTKDTAPQEAPEKAASPELNDMFSFAEKQETAKQETTKQEATASDDKTLIYGHDSDGGPTLTEQIKKVNTVPLRGFGDPEKTDNPKATKGTVSRKGVSSKEVDKENEKQGLLEKELGKETGRSRKTLDRDDEDDWVETKKGKRKNKKKSKIKGFDDDDDGADIRPSSRGAKSAVVALSIVCILLLAALSALYLDYARTHNELTGALDNAYLDQSTTEVPQEQLPTEPYATVSDMIATASEVNTLTEFMQRYNPDFIVYTDTDINDLVYVPVDKNLPQSDIDYTYVTLPDPDNKSRAFNDPNTGLTGIMGIDVSEYQGDIDWAKVAESGVKYAIIKVGARGYETGDLIDDPTFEENVEGALAAGIHVGVYFFSTATTVEEAVLEAQYTLDKIKDYDIKYPVVIDIEELSARKPEMTVAERTDNTIAFCEEVKAAGYIPMIYSGQNFFAEYLDMSRILDYEIWFAQYGVNRPFFPYRHAMWQYTASGVIPGIEENTVDLNIGFVDYASIVVGP